MKQISKDLQNMFHCCTHACFCTVCLEDQCVFMREDILWCIDLNFNERTVSACEKHSVLQLRRHLPQLLPASVLSGIRPRRRRAGEQRFPWIRLLSYICNFQSTNLSVFGKNLFWHSLLDNLDFRIRLCSVYGDFVSTEDISSHNNIHFRGKLSEIHRFF